MNYKVIIVVAGLACVIFLDFRFLSRRRRGKSRHVLGTGCLDSRHFRLSLLSPFDICCPTFKLIVLCGLNRVRSGIDAPTGNNEVRATIDRIGGGLVLLAEFVTLARQVDASREDQKVLSLAWFALAKRSRGDKANHGLRELASQIDTFLCVGSGREAALRRHLRKKEKGALVPEREVGRSDGLVQRLNNAIPTQDAEVHDVGPFRDSQGAAVILLLDRVADINQLAVFEDQEIVLLGRCLQSLHSRVVEVRD